ncbi:MAG: M23 family metallopeptidase, partial [Actinobacteria bacterium]|nr:M23 family metallopeptidase [Actinomycetota bacterium]
TIGWMHNQQGGQCCALEVNHDDGWSTVYIHLNNDTQNPDGSYSDDGQGYGIAPGLAPGIRVEAGQLIGWVGDSGNAEGVTPHLHFELRDPSDVAYNPYESLLAAQPLPDQPDPCPEETECDTAAFQDNGGRFTLWWDLVWGAELSSFFYGNPGDVAFSGDWNGDGVETLGLYRRSDGYVYLRNTNTQGVADISFYFGNPGDLPVAGDFDGDGFDTVSIYRPSDARYYVINDLGSNDGGLGAADYSFLFGDVGDKPFVGDFDGDDIDTIGLHRESTGLVYFRNSNTTGIADSQFIYGNPGDKIVAGDWDGDGDDTVAVYRPSNGWFYLKLENTVGNADVVLSVGQRTGAVALSP